MYVQSSKVHRYSSVVTRYALTVYLISRSAYFLSLRNFLHLPHHKTIMRKIGTMQDVGSQRECSAVIRTVFENLTNEEKQVTLIFDEMYISPAARFRGGHIIGHSEDNPNEIARTLFAVMVKPMFG